MPRCSIETLLHAFVPAAARRTTRIRTASTCSPARADGERLVARVLRRRRRLDPVHPARLHARPSRSARRSRDNPDLKLVVLAKHGLVVWGDSAEEAYRATIEVINQAVAFVNERTGGARALRRPPPRPLDDRAAASAAAAAAARDPRRGLERAAQAADASTPRRGRSSSSPRADAEQLVDRRRALPRPPRAHQARCRCGSRSTPTADDADALRERIAERRRGVPRRLPRLRRGATATRRPSRPTPTRGRAHPAPRPGRGRRRRRRPRGSRATSTTARSR